MPLVVANLRTALQHVLDGSTPSASAAAAGSNWGAAYDAYARLGAANAIVPVIPPTSTTALASALGAAFSTLPGVPGTVAGQIAAALVAYWSTAVFLGAIAPVNTAGILAAFVATFTGVVAVPGGTAASKATQIANALDAGTKAVTVTFVGPSTFPLA